MVWLKSILFFFIFINYVQASELNQEEIDYFKNRYNYYPNIELGIFMPKLLKNYSNEKTNYSLLCEARENVYKKNYNSFIICYFINIF